MRLAVLTSVETRHRYFANAIRAGFPTVAIGLEETGYSPALLESDAMSPNDREIVANHFAERARQEERFFGRNAVLPPSDGEIAIQKIAPGQLNSKQTLEWLESAAVDTIVVFGTNLIRQPLISRWPGRMLNMHLGLSPYYRGTATNFYPLLNEEPEYVGATIHLIDPGIDSGPIVRHARPEIEPGDRPHTIGCKAILAGIEAMKRSLDELQASGTLHTVPQWTPPRSRLYLRKDYDPRHVIQLYQKLDNGLIERYLDRRKRGEPEFRIIG